VCELNHISDVSHITPLSKNYVVLWKGYFRRKKTSNNNPPVYCYLPKLLLAVGFSDQSVTCFLICQCGIQHLVHLLVMVTGVSKSLECVKDDDRGRREPAGGPHGPVCPSL